MRLLMEAPSSIDPQGRFLAAVSQNQTLLALLDRLAILQLPDAWIAGGSLFQTAWNVLDGLPPSRGIQDYDIFYFDAQDLSRDGEEAINLHAAARFADLCCKVDLRNQARVHLWYQQEFGVAGYEPLTRSTDGIDRFLAVCCMVALRRGEGGEMELYAPLGVEDILSRTMRPNPWFRGAPRSAYDAKAGRWRGLWPTLTIVDAN